MPFSYNTVIVFCLLDVVVASGGVASSCVDSCERKSVERKQENVIPGIRKRCEAHCRAISSRKERRACHEDLSLNPKRCNATIDFSYLNDPCDSTCAVSPVTADIPLRNVSYRITPNINSRRSISAITFSWNIVPVPENGTAPHGFYLILNVFDEDLSSSMCIRILDPKANACVLSVEDFYKSDYHFKGQLFSSASTHTYKLSALPLPNDFYFQSFLEIHFPPRVVATIAPTTPKQTVSQETTSATSSFMPPTIFSGSDSSGLSETPSSVFSATGEPRRKVTLVAGLVSSFAALALICVVVIGRKTCKRQPKFKSSTSVNVASMEETLSSLSEKSVESLLEDDANFPAEFEVSSKSAVHNVIQNRYVRRVFVIYGTRDPQFSCTCRQIVIQLLQKWGIEASGIENCKEGFEGKATLTWVQEKVCQADYILLVCNKEIHDLFESNETPTARGFDDQVVCECCKFLRCSYIDQKINRKVIPILLSTEDECFVPFMMAIHKRYRWSTDEEQIARVIREEFEYVRQPETRSIGNDEDENAL